MNKKNSLMLLISLSSLMCSHVMSMEVIVWDQMLEIVDRIKDTHFADEHKDIQECFSGFSTDIAKTSRTNDNFGKMANTESMQQAIVKRLIPKMWHSDQKNEHSVAVRLAQYMPEYLQVCDDIENAFKPDGEIKSPWYANATKYMPPKYQNGSKGWGWSGGVMTPLSYAVKTANLDWSKKLIDAGADVNKRSLDTQGDMMSVLYETISLKYDREGWWTSNNNGKTLSAIHHDIILLFLARKAQVDLGCSIGEKKHIRPLQLAITHQDEAVLMCLFAYGAKRKMTDICMVDKFRAWFNGYNFPQVQDASEEEK